MPGWYSFSWISGVNDLLIFRLGRGGQDGVPPPRRWVRKAGPTGRLSSRISLTYMDAFQLSVLVLRPQPRVQDINGVMPPSSTAHSWKRLDNSCESMKAEDSIQATELNADHGKELSRPRCWLRWFHEHAPASRRAGEVIASASRSCSLEKGEERARFRAAATGRSGVLKSSR